MVTTSPFPEQNSDSFPNEEDEEGPPNRGRGVAMITPSPFPKEKSDPFPNEAIDTSSSPLVSLGPGHLTTPFVQKNKEDGLP